MDIACFLCRSDNYAVLIRDPVSGLIAAIDAPDAAAIEAALEARSWALDTIFVTHRHFDHVEGIVPLKAKYGCQVIAPQKAAAEVTADQYVMEGDRLTLGAVAIEVWETPGHCADHIAYFVPQDGVIFTGDTLFAMGCGRIFDATPADLFASLRRFAALPDATKVYCGHEYTLSNARFAVTIEPENAAIIARLAAVEAMRARGEMTIPTTIGAEKATNVFLRARNVAELAARREAKNRA